MSEERITEIQQGKRIYRFACTEEIEIGGSPWTRDRYQNSNGDKSSFLLVNFKQKKAPVNKTQESPNPNKTPTDYRKYIEEWKGQGLIK